VVSPARRSSTDRATRPRCRAPPHSGVATACGGGVLARLGASVERTVAIATMGEATCGECEHAVCCE
jgi:hypothetical protein